MFLRFKHSYFLYLLTLAVIIYAFLTSTVHEYYYDIDKKQCYSRNLISNELRQVDCGILSKEHKPLRLLSNISREQVPQVF